MPTLKEYRNRIASVKSTRKITSAMKMVAASKLRRAQQQAEASQPYSTRMFDMLSRLVSKVNIDDSSPFLLAGTGNQNVHLLIVITSDRGLCGGFNGSIARMARSQIRELLDEGKEVKILCIGSKGRDVLKREFADKIVHTFEGLGRKHQAPIKAKSMSAHIVDSFANEGKKNLGFDDAMQIAQYVIDMGERREFDVCTVLYNKFKSVLSQIPSSQQLIPFYIPEKAKEPDHPMHAVYEFEPDEEEILKDLLPRNLSVQIYRALLDSAAGQQGARMTAMENATKNAGEMINKLTLRYNRARQAYITTQLIEIISGAEAV